VLRAVLGLGLGTAGLDYLTCCLLADAGAAVECHIPAVGSWQLLDDVVCRPTEDP